MDQSIVLSPIEMFKKTLDELYPLPEADFERLSQVFTYRKYNKGEVILQEGKICKQLWYIIKGCVRIFSVENGVDVNVRFFFEGSVAADFISLRHDICSNFFMVALEETEVLCAYKKDYKPILTFSKSLVQLTAEFFAHHFFDELEQTNSFKLMTPEERYNNLLQTRPKFFQRIPLTYLASYLGMSRKTLSRIRSNAH